MDVRILKEFIAEVLTICKNDDTGVTDDLIDLAFNSGQELGMTKEEMEYIYACA